VILLRTYAVDGREHDKHASREAFAECRAIYGNAAVELECADSYDYWRHLENAWRAPGSLVTVEQDVVVLPSHVAELEACPSTACVFAYDIYPVRDGVVTPECVHRGNWPGESAPLGEGDKWASLVGLGCARIRQELRESVVPTPAVPRVPWRELAGALCTRLDVAWHVHWPRVVHDHWPGDAVA